MNQLYPSPVLKPFAHYWPRISQDISRFAPSGKDLFHATRLMQNKEDWQAESSWPVFFPSSLCLLTAIYGKRVACERILGANIVNRNPYLLAVSVCQKDFSLQYHSHRQLMEILEKGEGAALQLLPPGPELATILQALMAVPEAYTGMRLAHSGLETSPAITNPAPVLRSAYLVFEVRLVKPGKDVLGHRVHEVPWLDVGSHRLYFLEVTAVQLRQDLAEERSRILWHGLPFWQPQLTAGFQPEKKSLRPKNLAYKKSYTARYYFPTAKKAAVKSEEVKNGRAVYTPPALSAEPKQVGPDQARKPYFFPASLGLLTSWAENSVPNVMPCGAVTIVSRQPLVVAACVCYAKHNGGFTPRASLAVIQKSRKFSCGVPYNAPEIIDAIEYAGNVSLLQDSQKLEHTGLEYTENEYGPLLSALPLHLDCQVTKEVRLGTHMMFLGEVQKIWVRRDVTPENPIAWYPWPEIVSG